MNKNFYLCFYDSVIVSYYKVVLISRDLFIYLFIYLRYIIITIITVIKLFKLN